MIYIEIIKFFYLHTLLNYQESFYRYTFIDFFKIMIFIKMLLNLPVVWAEIHSTATATWSGYLIGSRRISLSLVSRPVQDLLWWRTSWFSLHLPPTLSVAKTSTPPSCPSATCAIPTHARTAPSARRMDPRIISASAHQDSMERTARMKSTLATEILVIMAEPATSSMTMADLGKCCFYSYTVLFLFMFPHIHFWTKPGPDIGFEVKTLMITYRKCHFDTNSGMLINPSNGEATLGSSRWLINFLMLHSFQWIAPLLILLLCLFQLPVSGGFRGRSLRDEH